jgi:predicted dehydrogenase
VGEIVRLGMLGSGFIADFYMAGLRDVPEARVTAAYSRSAARAADFARRHDVARIHDSVDALCADPDVDLVVVCLPNHRHLEAVEAAAAAGKGVLCTKPLGRNGSEAAAMVRAVRAAGVFAGYLENEVFSPDVMRARQMVASGAIGDVLSMRSREGHSGPHAPHFWDAETAGGGALLDMGCHCIEAIRYVRGKEHRVVDVFAWGATLAHGARTTAEDTAIAILRFADGRTATIEASWTARGGMEVRNEVYGTKGRIVHDTSATSLRAFIEEPAGYLVEKADAETGWVFPIADEARVYGYGEQFRDMIGAFRAGAAPRETFEDGYIVNCILDAAYRSMRSGRWEPVDVDEEFARA